MSSTKFIYDLCPEILQIIFGKYENVNHWLQLIKLRLVCKDWKLNIDDYLATKKSFQITGRKTNGYLPPTINLYQVHGTLRFYPNLKNLKLKDFTISDHVVVILKHTVPRLEKLELRGCPGLSYEGITTLSICFNQLKFIDVSHCELDEMRMRILVENLQNLEVLYAINPGMNVTGQCLKNLGPNMKDLWIGFNQLTNCNPALNALVTGHGKNLSHLGLIVDNIHLIDWSIITDNVPQLKTLKLTFSSIKKSNIQKIAKLRNLEFLVLAETTYNEKESVLTDENLIPILRGCKKLTSLALAGLQVYTLRITNQSIELIPSLCPNMEQIRFSMANNINDQCLISLANMQRLYALHFSSTNNITNEGVIAFAKQSRSVRNFRVANCPAITEEIIPTWIDVSNNRSNENIRLFLENMEITQSLDDLPKNLLINPPKIGQRD